MFFIVILIYYKYIYQKYLIKLITDNEKNRLKNIYKIYLYKY